MRRHHSKSSLDSRFASGSTLLLALMIASTPAWAEADMAAPQAALQCLGTVGEIQGVRDNLEVAVVYLTAAKDNFGPARQHAVDMTRDALAEFERLHGEPQLTPTPGTEVARYLGAHGHPRMKRALGVLHDVKGTLNRSACQHDARLDSLRQDVDRAISDIYKAFSFNPPGSGR